MMSESDHPEKRDLPFDKASFARALDAGYAEYYQARIRELEKRLEENPNDIRARIEYACHILEEGALATLDKMYEEDGDLSQPDFLYCDSNWPKASAEFKKLPNYDPLNPDYFLNLIDKIDTFSHRFARLYLLYATVKLSPKAHPLIKEQFLKDLIDGGYYTFAETLMDAGYIKTLPPYEEPKYRALIAASDGEIFECRQYYDDFEAKITEYAKDSAEDPDFLSHAIGRIHLDISLALYKRAVNLRYDHPDDARDCLNSSEEYLNDAAQYKTNEAHSITDIRYKQIADLRKKLNDPDYGQGRSPK